MTVMCISHSQFNDTFTGLLAFSFDKRLVATAFCCVLVFRKCLKNFFIHPLCHTVHLYLSFAQPSITGTEILFETV